MSFSGKWGVCTFLQGGVFWLDHSSLVPPYFPFARGEDTLFAHLLSGIDRSFLAAYVPWSFTHRLYNQRESFAPLRQDPVHVHYAYRLISHLLNTLVPLASSFAELPMDQALRHMGCELRQYLLRDAARFPEQRIHHARLLVSSSNQAERTVDRATPRHAS